MERNEKPKLDFSFEKDQDNVSNNKNGIIYYSPKKDVNDVSIAFATLEKDSYRTSPTKITSKFPRAHCITDDTMILPPLESSRIEDGTIEPKVFVMYENREGYPPRKLEVERKRRLYESANVDVLVKDKMSELYNSTEYKRLISDESMELLQILELLDISLFDDTKFEIHDPLEWIQLGKKSDGSIKIPVTALYKVVGMSPIWKNAFVTAYLEEKKNFQVCFQDENNNFETHQLNRLEICFKVEDPQNFVERVYNAHISRLQVVSILKVNLLVDLIPTDDLPQLGGENIQRIQSLASQNTKVTNTGVTSGSQKKYIDPTPILKEIQYDYTRSMAKIIFEEHYYKDKNKIVYDNVLYNELITTQKRNNKKKVTFFSNNIKKRNSMISLIDNDNNTIETNTNINLSSHGKSGYSDQFIGFSFQTFLTCSEALQSIIKVNEECKKIAEIQLFSLKSNRSLKLEEFVQRQIVHQKTILKTIHDDWPIKITNTIKSLLSNVGKGWYNLRETKRDTYEFSKLKILLYRIKIMMQDTIRYLTENSLNACRDFYFKRTDCSIHIKDAKNVLISYPDIKRELLGDIKWEFLCRQRAFRSSPGLFSLYLSVSTKKSIINKKEIEIMEKKIANWRPSKKNDDDEESIKEECPYIPIKPIEGFTFDYSTPMDDFETTILDIFDKTLDSLKDIKQIEPSIMDNLFWSNHPCIPFVSLHEEGVQTIRLELSKMILKSKKPLKDYLGLFDKYIQFLNMNEEEYLTNFKSILSTKTITDGNNNNNNTITNQSVHSYLSNLQETIKMHNMEWISIEENISDLSIELGLFSINCSSIRSLLSEKHQRISNRLLENHLKHSILLAKEINQKYEIINRQLQKIPSDIEQLSEMNEFITNKIHIQMEPLIQESNYLIHYKNVLDYFNYPLEKEDFFEITKVQLCPRIIQDQIIKMKSILQIQKSQFSNEMKDQQTNFIESLKNLHTEVDSFKQYTDLNRLDQVYKHVQAIEIKLNKAEQDAKLYNSREILFSNGLPNTSITDYDEVNKIRKDFESFSMLWKTANTWLKESNKLIDGSFLDINGEELESFVETNWQIINKASKYFEKIGLKGCNDVAIQIKNEISKFRPHVPLILALRNPGMQERHWNILNNEININMTFRPDRGMKLNYVLELGLDKYLDNIVKIGETAGKEYQIEKTLNQMEETMKHVTLQIIEYRNTGTYILKGMDEIQAIIDEQITNIQTIQFSVYKKPFIERIDRWEKLLITISDVIEEWIQVQRSWLYLQPIFDSPDINKQLPIEGKKFASVDKNWRQTLQSAKSKPNLIYFCNNEKLLERFQESKKFLDQVQKGLSDYLETKRSGFCRFYFLSNDELLSILSESKDIRLVQPHLKKCFEGIVAIELIENNTTATNNTKSFIITSMISAEGEKVKFSIPIDPTNKNVENWMIEVEDMMRISIRNILKDSIIDYTKISRIKWIQKWPGMCVLNGSQLHWTKEMEENMNLYGEKGVELMYQQQLAQLTDMVIMVRGHLEKNARITVGALTVIDVHARDVTYRLMNNKVNNKNDFMWSSQLRYYWETDDLYADMVAARRPYGYEYLGNSFRLVITPLTDKCYMTLMAALQMVLGGAPAGPAGTGKTETTKDLAKALAKQCVVFNCSDGLDYIAMGKFFKGLASCGAWACFDEFNRINIEVLSVIGQQITILQLAIRAKENHIIFEGSNIVMNPQFGVFITMNPGYAGRSDLPDSLAALFRPVAMMVPDYAMIGEIMFFAYGYEKAKQCGAKMVTTFKLCSEQLSSQCHYDYGMRAVKTVITAAGNLKRQDPDMDEEILLLRALQDVNLPKFLAADIPLFEGIINDLFPGKKRPQLNLGKLHSTIKDIIKKKNLQPHPVFITKIIQLYETLVVRHGLMVVGPTGGGKSSNISVLADSLTELKRINEIGFSFEKIIISQLNPKSITMGQLYGEFDPNTHEWQDGILSTLYREAALCTKSDRKWIIFDGPVDAIWVENMNTVLDDNKKLCLNSGEIIQMSNQMTMMFEVEDLSVASPATVSRTGMIYMEPSSLGYDPLIRSWLEDINLNINDEIKCQLQYYIDVYFVNSLSFISNYTDLCLPQINNNLLQSLFRLINSFFNNLNQETIINNKTSDNDLLNKNIESLFIFSLIWSVGATSIDIKSREKFDFYLRNEMFSNNAKKLIPNQNNLLVYDYKYDIKTESWIEWLSSVPVYTIDNNITINYSEFIIPTTDSTRNIFLLENLSYDSSHILMVGPTGTGKTSNINQFLESLDNDIYIPLKITFSAQTSANQIQDFLDTKMEKRKKGVYGPAVGKKFIIYIDDLNMPKQEKYFAQPPIEILRQWFNQNGWYDRKLLSFRTIVDIIFITSMGPPGGGRNSITSRFIRHFNTITYTEMLDSSKKVVFETILSSFLSKFSSSNITTSLKVLVQRIVKASIHIYNTILLELLPTPAKSHYTFNLRDLSKVFQGLLMGDPKKIITIEQLLRLWIHENQRVFQDRLTNSTDHEWFIKILKAHLYTNFSDLIDLTNNDNNNDNNNTILDDSIDLNQNNNITTTQRIWNTIVPNKNLFYGDYMYPGADPKIYEEINEIDRLQTMIEDYLNDYNTETNASPMNLVMFLNAIEHVSRISRIIRQPQGNVLLLGVGGSGRQSLTKLATYMAEYICFQVEIIKGYGLLEWKEDLKKCLMMAGIQGKQVVFLFSDVQIINETMLEDINNILNAGDVPNLYGNEEMEQILAQCRPLCVKKNKIPTKLNIFGQYILQIRQNLHVVLCMSPLGETFRDRLRMFPSLVNCCTIDWFSEWPQEALQSVASKALSTDNLLKENELSSIVSIFQIMHQSVEVQSKHYFQQLKRYNYVTPTSYLELLFTFKSVLQNKRDEVQLMRNRLQNGVDKIVATKSQVAGMQEQLIALKPQLEKTQKEVEDMMKKINIDKKDADETKRMVEKEECVANKKAAETKEIAHDAQRDLDEALPALDAATQCLNKLKKSDIDEVKAMKNPPHGVRLTMEAACIIFGIKPTIKTDADKPGQKIKDYWESAQKTILSNAKKLLDDMLKFDKDNIPEKIIQQIDPYIEMEEFAPLAVRKASVACEAICMWVRAMYTYNNVSKMVEPKKKALAEAQIELDITLNVLKDAKDRLDAVVKRLEDLENNYNIAILKKNQLANDVLQCEIRLDSALKLINLLGGEETRWTSTVLQLDKDYINLIGDVIISSGTISYLGAFTNEYRMECIQLWYQSLNKYNVNYTNNCTIITTLSDPIKIRSWQIAGLPSDNLSIQNGIIMSKARRWPLLIDPQGQANRFIKNLGKENSENGIDIVKLSDKNFLKILENGVRFGKWILLENVLDTLDATLEPILLQIKFRHNGQIMMKIGDSNVPYHSSFRFFITTKLPNPHYSPETCVKVTLLNFTITPKGLEEQALGVVVQEEMPELAEKKNLLVVSNAKMKYELVEIENKILYMLANSVGNILDDTELIDTLGKAKITSQDINIKMKEAEITEKEIDSKSESYRSVAFRTSLLYFCIADLTLIDPMYQYSLQWYIELFIKGIQNAEQNNNLNERLENLNNYCTYSLYKNICRSLFEEHKLLFSFLLTIKILQGYHLIDDNEWRFLISGGGNGTPSTNDIDLIKNYSIQSDYIWIDDRIWNEFLILSTLDNFNNIDKHMIQYPRNWKYIFDSIDPQTEKLPLQYENKYSSFQKLLILRCIRPDRMMEGILNFVIEKLGRRFIEPPVFDLSSVYSDSTVITPLIFILSTGSDPAKELLLFAESMKMSKKLNSISLGQGQGILASKMIQDGMLNGKWVLLQNCHLSISWMPQLERICEDLDVSQIHKDFRLWLTSKPLESFPTSILQNGIKMTKEPPKGIRANLKNIYLKLTNDQLDKTIKPNEYKKLLFGLSFFHAIVIERKKYGPLGWNIPYAFNDTDFDISRSQLEMFIDFYPDYIPYKVLCVMTSIVNYGGRVTDDKDMRTIDIMLETFFNEKIMQNGYSFTYKSNIYYSIPFNCTNPIGSYIEYIDNLPIQPEPEAFGMHDNANITCAMAETIKILDIIQSLQPKGISTNTNSKTREEIIDLIALNIYEKLPDLFDLDKLSIIYPIIYDESMNTVFLQEIQRYNNLISIMKDTLPNLRKALKGLIVMSNDLEIMSSCIFNQKVPPSWERNAYPSLKALSPWVEELLSRISFFTNWSINGIPNVFSLSSFYFPQGFLTGTLQNYARRKKVPIDSLSFSYLFKNENIQDIINQPVEGGCYITGLFIEGARWDKTTKSLEDPLQKELFSKIPIIHLLPIKDRIAPISDIYRCPVYKILTRTGTLSTTGHSTNFVFWIEIPSNKYTIFRNSLVSETNAQVLFADQDYWIKAGVACFLSLRY